MMPEMGANAKKNLAVFNAVQDDWYTTCPLCKTNLSGTLVELKAHKCQEVKNVA